MLSDSCFEFFHTFGQIATTLADEVCGYASADNPIRYGDEIDVLRRMASRVGRDPFDIEEGIELLRLAYAIQRNLDAPPDGAPIGSPLQLSDRP